MKVNCKIFRICLILMILTIIFSIIAFIYIDYWKWNQYIHNLSLNVFAGLVATLMVTIVNYNIEKRKLFSSLVNSLGEIGTLIGKIDYIDFELIDYEEFCKKLSLNTITKKSHDMYKKYIQESFKIDIYIEKYENIYNSNDFKMISNLYDDIQFIFDFKNTKKYEIFHNIVEYVQNLHNDLGSIMFHIDQYKKAKNGNKKALLNIIKTEQKKMFNKVKQPKSEENISKNFNNIIARANYVFANDNKHIIYNNTQIELYDKATFCGKIAYSSKYKYFLEEE